MVCGVCGDRSVHDIHVALGSLYFKDPIEETFASTEIFRFVPSQDSFPLLPSPRRTFFDFFPPRSISKWPAFSARLCSVFLIRPDEYFCKDGRLTQPLDGKKTLVRNKILCRGRIHS